MLLIIERSSNLQNTKARLTYFVSGDYSEDWRMSGTGEIISKLCRNSEAIRSILIIADLFARIDSVGTFLFYSFVQSFF